MVTASDGFLTVDDNFLVTVADVNDPPQVSNPAPDLSIDEHFTTTNVDLSNVFTDPDGDLLSFSPVSMPGLIAVPRPHSGSIEVEGTTPGARP